MALPASGNLSLKDAATISRSIAQEVDGNIIGDKSLCALSLTALKTAPHGMREFYGYSNTSTVSIITYYSTGSEGTPNVCRRACLCITPALTSGQCFCAQLCVCLCNTNTNPPDGSGQSCSLICLDPFTCCTNTNFTDTSICQWKCDICFSVANNGAKICISGLANNFSVPARTVTATASVCIICIYNGCGRNFQIGSPSCVRAEAVDNT